MYKTHLRHLVFLLLTLLLFSCMSRDKPTERQTRKQVYIDANLLFEVSYHEEWVRLKRQTHQTPIAKQTTTWQINNKQKAEIQPELSITSIPAERNPYGYTGLETIIIEQNSELSIQTSIETTLPAGPVRKITGQSSQATYVIWLYLGELRHYIICCSTATSAFEQQQFQQIVDSFKPFK